MKTTKVLKANTPFKVVGSAQGTLNPRDFIKTAVLAIFTTIGVPIVEFIAAAFKFTIAWLKDDPTAHFGMPDVKVMAAHALMAIQPVVIGALLAKLVKSNKTAVVKVDEGDVRKVPAGWVE